MTTDKQILLGEYQVIGGIDAHHFHGVYLLCQPHGTDVKEMLTLPCRPKSKHMVQENSRIKLSLTIYPTYILGIKGFSIL